jgi:hypothetical protein
MIFHTIFMNIYLDEKTNTYTCTVINKKTNQECYNSVSEFDAGKP